MDLVVPCAGNRTMEAFCWRVASACCVSGRFSAWKEGGGGETERERKSERERETRDGEGKGRVSFMSSITSPKFFRISCECNGLMRLMSICVCLGC